jgi:hypothetical protein
MGTLLYWVSADDIILLFLAQRKVWKKKRLYAHWCKKYKFREKKLK